MLEVIILSVVQGVTEFLPISSSAHLILISKYFNFNNANVTLDVCLHLGSLLAIIYYFKQEFLNFIKNKELFLKIILSSVPIIIIGFFLIKFNLIDYFRNYKVIGWSTVIFGFFLYITDKFKIKKTLKKNFNYRTVIYIGLFQVLALIPGVSRSGITISGARFLKFNRLDAAKISFLLSIPTLSAASLFGMQQLIKNSSYDVSLLNLLGIFLSFLFSYFTIKFLIKFLIKFNLTSFVVYRVILGSIILIYAY
ncbi:MAG: undecaprenyl-diphosphate phosphatase [Pelagibacteraceae bacterium]|jgi:undecaprenyl-diphosphatase|nr:undecaprenyl-diphosphate phosphatase [Pelagibacteraceae bacterium]